MSATDDDTSNSEVGFSTEDFERISQQSHRRWSGDDIEALFDRYLTQQEEMTITQEELEKAIPDPVDTSSIQDSVREGAILISVTLLFALIGIYGLWFGATQNTSIISLVGIAILAVLAYHLWTLNTGI